MFIEADLLLFLAHAALATLPRRSDRRMVDALALKRYRYLRVLLVKERPLTAANLQMQLREPAFALTHSE